MARRGQLREGTAQGLPPNPGAPCRQRRPAQGRFKCTSVSVFRGTCNA
jgi:hypothetical protein